MANEAVIIELLGNKGDPIRMTCASGTAIAKGTLMKLTDPRTASASSSTDIFAGIAAMEKSSSDESTSISLYTKGIFDLRTANAVTAGQLVSLSGANLIKTAVATDVEQGKIVGKALETSTEPETIAVAVGVYG